MKLLAGIIMFCFCVQLHSQDLIAFKQNNLYGFINIDGKVVIKPEFDNVTYFGSSDFLIEENKEFKIFGSPNTVLGLNLAHVRIDSFWTVIDKKGNKLFPCTSPRPLSISCFSQNCSVYYQLRSVVDSLLLSKPIKIYNKDRSQWRLYHLGDEAATPKVYIVADENNPFRSGLQSPPAKPYVIARTENKKYDLIENKTGQLIVEDAQKIIEICDSQFIYSDSAEGNYILDLELDELNKVPYPKVIDFHTSRVKDVNSVNNISSDLSRIRITEKNDKNCLYNFIAVSGNSKQSRGIIDKEFNLFIDTIYESVAFYSNHFVATFNVDDQPNEKRIDVFKESGEKLNLPECKQVWLTSRQLILAKLTSDKYVILNTNGLPYNKETYDYLNSSSSSYIKYNQGEIAGILDNNGDVIINYPCDRLMPFQHGVNKTKAAFNNYLVVKGDQQGLLSFERELIYMPEYKRIQKANYNNYVFLTSNEDKMGLGSSKGEILIPIKYDKISREFVGNSQCHFLCYKNGKLDKRLDENFKLTKSPEEPKEVEEKLIPKGNYPTGRQLNVEKFKGKEYLFSNHGKQLSEQGYHDLVIFNFTNQAIALGLNKSLIIEDIYNSKGKLIVSKPSIKLFRDRNNNYVFFKELSAFKVIKDDKVGILKSNGEYLIPPNKFEHINITRYFNYGTRTVENYAYKTLFDKQLNQISELDFWFIRKYRHDDYLVSIPDQQKDNEYAQRYGVINKHGKILIPLDYNQAYIGQDQTLILTKIDEEGKPHTQLLNNKFEIIHEGPYDSMSGYNKETVESYLFREDTIITLKPDGSTEITFQERSYIGDTDIELKLIDEECVLVDANGQVICKEKKGQALVHPKLFKKLRDDRYLLKHWDKVLILNKKGEILDNLLCKKVQEITKTLISTGSTGSYSKLLKTDHEKKLFEQNLITIDCDSESYLYNFETLKKFPDEN